MKYCDKLDCKQQSDVCVPSTEFPRVLVIGGGFAGLNVAKYLKNKPVQVVLIDKNNFHQFNPLLYQVATSGIEPDNIVFPYRKIFRKYKNLVYRMAHVEKIDTGQNRVSTSIGDISYDYLIIATGSTTNFFGNTVIEKQSIGLKSVVDALDIRSLLLQNLERTVLKCVNRENTNDNGIMIVGGGPAGVEMAGALAEFKKYIIPRDYPELSGTDIPIILVEGKDRLLAGMHDKLSDKTYAYLDKMGVEIKLNTIVTNYQNNVAEFSDGSTVMASSLIWTAGVKGEILSGIDEKFISRQKRIIVDEYNKVTFSNNVFAIGDVAQMITDDCPTGHPMVAQVAIQQGKNVAFNIISSLKGKQLRKFSYNDKGTLATIGKNKAVARIGKIYIWGTAAWLIWSVVHLMGILGVRNKFLTGFNWLWNWITYDRGDRVIIRKYTRSL